jgi:hypothetical protein
MSEDASLLDQFLTLLKDNAALMDENRALQQAICRLYAQLRNAEFDAETAQEILDQVITKTSIQQTTYSGH